MKSYAIICTLFILVSCKQNSRPDSIPAEAKELKYEVLTGYKKSHNAPVTSITPMIHNVDFILEKYYSPIDTNDQNTTKLDFSKYTYLSIEYPRTDKDESIQMKGIYSHGKEIYVNYHIEGENYIDEKISPFVLIAIPKDTIIKTFKLIIN